MPNSTSTSSKHCTRNQLSTAVGVLRRILNPAVQPSNKGLGWVQNGDWFALAIRSQKNRHTINFAVTHKSWMISAKPDDATVKIIFDVEFRATYLSQDDLKDILNKDGSKELVDLLLSTGSTD